MSISVHGNIFELVIKDPAKAKIVERHANLILALRDEYALSSKACTALHEAVSDLAQ